MPCCRAQCCPMEGLQLPSSFAAGPSAALWKDSSSQHALLQGLVLPYCWTTAPSKGPVLDYNSQHASVLPYGRTTAPIMPCWACLAGPSAGLNSQHASVLSYTSHHALLQGLSAALWKDSSPQHASALPYGRTPAPSMPCFRAQCWTTTPSMPCTTAPIMPCCTTNLQLPSPPVPLCAPPPPHRLHPGGEGKGGGGRGGGGGV